jgi:hypothetical protein
VWDLFTRLFTEEFLLLHLNKISVDSEELWNTNASISFISRECTLCSDGHRHCLTCTQFNSHGLVHTWGIFWGTVGAHWCTIV